MTSCYLWSCHNNGLPVVGSAGASRERKKNQLKGLPSALYESAQATLGLDLAAQGMSTGDSNLPVSNPSDLETVHVGDSLPPAASAPWI